jgi:CRP-like cAMP-binding protein
VSALLSALGWLAVDQSRLAAIPLFASLPAEQLQAVAAVASERTFEKGETLTEEGSFGHGLFVIEEGTAEVQQEGTTIRSAAKGDVIGEIAVLAAGRRSATVVATSSLRVIALFKPDVWALERQAPEVAETLRGLIERRTGGLGGPPIRRHT